MAHRTARGPCVSSSVPSGLKQGYYCELSLSFLTRWTMSLTPSITCGSMGLPLVIASPENQIPR